MPPVDSTRTWTSHFVQERKRGERVTDLKRHFKIDVTPERFQVLTQSGIVFSEDLPIEPDTVAVRIFVLDRFSSAIGSVTMAVDAGNKSGVKVAPVWPMAGPAAVETNPFCETRLHYPRTYGL